MRWISPSSCLGRFCIAPAVEHFLPFNRDCRVIDPISSTMSGSLSFNSAPNNARRTLSVRTPTIRSVSSELACFAPGFASFGLFDTVFPHLADVICNLGRDWLFAVSARHSHQLVGINIIAGSDAGANHLQVHYLKIGKRVGILLFFWLLHGFLLFLERPDRSNTRPHRLQGESLRSVITPCNHHWICWGPSMNEPF